MNDIMKCKRGETYERGKRKARRKAVQTNENTKIRIQEVDEEKWICMQAEAYYRALKRIEAQKEIKNPESSVQLTRKEQILYIINFFFFPFKIFGKVKLKKEIYNLSIVFATSFIMELVGTAAWLGGLCGIPYLILKGELPFDIAIIAMGILLIFIGSMLIIGVRSFEKEEDSNKIYAFTASFLALASLCVSIVTLLIEKI